MEAPEYLADFALANGSLAFLAFAFLPVIFPSKPRVLTGVGEFVLECDGGRLGLICIQLSRRAQI